MSLLAPPLSHLRRVARSTDGVVTIEFTIIFPIFMFIFLMIVESGVMSLRQVMLEHGTEVAVRDVRLGRITNSDSAEFQLAVKERICGEATMIPDCMAQLQIEMLRRSPRAFTALPADIPCVDRSQTVQPSVTFTTAGNNDLMFLRVCARVDALFPTTGIGRAIVEQNDGDAAGGSLALISEAAFVVEPFQ